MKLTESRSTFNPIQGAMQTTDHIGARRRRRRARMMKEAKEKQLAEKGAKSK